MIQLTWDTYDKPFCVKSDEECFHISCTEASGCKCCSGCKEANKCTSRCVRSYKFVYDYDEELIQRHKDNLLPTLKHNCGTVLLYEYTDGNRAYGFVKAKEK